MSQTKDSETQALEAELDLRRREVGMLTDSLVETQITLERERAAHEETRQALEAAELASQSYHDVIQSTSWRLTAPLRYVMAKLQR